MFLHRGTQLGASKLRILQRIRTNLQARMPRPLQVAVNITGRCNLLCEFCEKSQRGPRAELPLGDLQHLVDLASAFRCPLFVGGGEPFLHRDVWGLLAYCLERDVPVEMVSNGTLLGNLTDGQHDLLGRSVRLLRVSLDSADPLEHDRIRGRTGAFDKTVRFLRDPRRQVHCEILSVLTPDIERVEPMIELAAELGCRLILQPLMFESNFPGLSERVAWKVTAQRRLAAQRGVERALTRLERYARSRGVQTNLPFIRLYAPTYFRCAGTPGFFQDRLMGKFTCVIPHQRITVDESGTLLPCVLLPGKHSIRSRDRDQIYDTWLQMATKYRRMFRRGTRYRQCRSCSCHFSENFHGSLVAFPWQNRALIRWKLATVVRRSLAARLLGSSTHPGNGNGSPVRLGQDPS